MLLQIKDKTKENVPFKFVPFCSELSKRSILSDKSVCIII